MESVITEEMKKHLRSCFLFAGTDGPSPELTDQLLGGASAFARGEIVYRSSDFRNALGVIVSGDVRICTSDAENRVILRDMSAGESFGAAALFGAGESYVSDIRAKSACTVVFIGEDMLKRLFSEYPASAVNYIAFLSAKIRYLNRKIAELSLRGAEARVFDYLRKNAADGTLEIRNMSALAKTLNIGRSSLYRALDTLEASGHIAKDGCKFKIQGENIL
jgi:CRP-like cAMP-binding protein